MCYIHGSLLLVGTVGTSDYARIRVQRSGSKKAALRLPGAYLGMATTYKTSKLPFSTGDAQVCK